MALPTVETDDLLFISIMEDVVWMPLEQLFQ